VSRGGQIYFEPAWGEFDMPVGEGVTSVFGGPADRSAYGDYQMGGVSTQPGRQSPYTADELKIFDCYSKVRDIRRGTNLDAYENVVKSVLADFRDEWLLALEVWEISQNSKLSSALSNKVFELLIGSQDSKHAERNELVAKGIKIANVPD
jgi:phenylalanine-4-hydroxylase